MIDLNEVFNPNLINLHVNATNKKEMIEQLAETLVQENRITNKDLFVEGVLEREKEGTTGFGYGIAIPHCKSELVKHASVVLGKSKRGIEWDALDGKPVYFVIMIAIPVGEENTTHLQILSRIAEKLMDDEFRSKIMQVTKEQELLKIFMTNVS